MQPHLTFRRVAAFYLPLALSWLLMSVESPISVSIISRTPDARTLTAGFLLMMAISLWIESPVIDLLSTTTTLGKSRQAIDSIRRFAILILGGVTAVHALVALTPVYDFVVRTVLQVPDAVADATRIPLAIMIPWSACIGWRRWRQGLMIRHGMTHPITLGTGLRMLTILGVGFLLLHFTQWDGLKIVAAALVTSVFVEAAFIHFAAKPALAKQPDDPEESLTQAQLWRFHLPLTGSTLVMLTSTPLVGAALARVQDPVLQMAAWQIATALSFNFRVATFGLSELVIALAKTGQQAMVVRRFALTLGFSLAFLMLLAWGTGWDAWFFRTVLRAPEETLEAARLGFIAALPFPILGCMMGYMKGRLTQNHLTMARLWAILIGITALLAALATGIHFRWPGVLVAAGSIVFGQIVELLVYVAFWRRSEAYRQARGIGTSAPLNS